MQNQELNNNDYSAPLVKELKELPEKPSALTNPTPDNPPWNNWAAVGVWLASVAFIVILPNLFLLPYIARQTVDLSDRVRLLEFIQSDSTAVLLSVAAVIPAHVLTLILSWLVVTRLNKFSFRQTLGWNAGGFGAFHYAGIIVGFFIIAAVTSYFVPEQENDLLRILKSSRAAVFVVAFLATFTAPLVEEVVYRGVLYSSLQRSYGIPAAVFLTTLLFALVHVPQYYPSYSTIFLICLLSLVLTLVRVKTKNLLPCVILHTIFNGIQSLLLVLQPYLPESLDALPEKAGLVIQLIK